MALQLEKDGLLPIGLGVVVCGWEGRGEGIGVWARVVAAVRAAWNLINQLNREHNRTPLQQHTAKILARNETFF